MLAACLVLAAVISSSASQPTCELPPIEEPHKHLVENVKIILDDLIKAAVDLGPKLINTILEFRDKNLKGDKQEKFGQALQNIFDVIKLNLGKLPKILQLTFALVKQILDCLDVPEIIQIVTNYISDVKGCIGIFTDGLAQAENNAVQIVLDFAKELDLDSCTNIFCKIERLSKLPEIIKNVNVVKRIFNVIGSIVMDSFDSVTCGILKTSVVAIKAVKIVDSRIKCVASIGQETSVDNNKSIGNEVKVIVGMIKDIVDNVRTEVTSGISEMFGILNFIEKGILGLKLAPLGLAALDVKNKVTKTANQILPMWEIDLENALAVYACRIEDYYYDIFAQIKIIPVVLIKGVDLIIKAIRCSKNIVCLLGVATNIPPLLGHAVNTYRSIKMIFYNLFMLAKQTVQAVKDAIAVSLSW